MLELKLPEEPIQMLSEIRVRRILAVFPTYDSGSPASLTYAFEAHGGNCGVITYRLHRDRWEGEDPYAEQRRTPTEAIAAAYARAGWSKAALTADLSDL